METNKDKKQGKTYADVIREEIATILGIPVSDEIEKEDENDIKYQLDDSEKDRIQKLKRKLKKIKLAENTKKPDDTEKKAEDEGEKKSEKELAGQTNSSDKKTQDSEIEFKVGRIRGFLLKFFRWLKSIAKPGGFIDKFCTNIEAGLLSGATPVQKLQSGMKVPEEVYKEMPGDKKKPAVEVKEMPATINPQDCIWIKDMFGDDSKKDAKSVILKNIVKGQKEKLDKDIGSNSDGIKSIMEQENIKPVFEDDQLTVLYARTAKNILARAQREGIKINSDSGERKPISDIYNELAEKYIARKKEQKAIENSRKKAKGKNSRGKDPKFSEATK